MAAAKKQIILLLYILLLMALPSCKKPVQPITEKGRQLMGKTWTYDTEATRRTVMQKAHDSLGGGIKNIKDIRLGGDVKKMADALSAQTLTFWPDQNGRGMAFLLTEGQGFLMQKTEGIATWNADETLLTLTPDNKRKPLVYTVKELTANKLVILPEKTATETAEVYLR